MNASSGYNTYGWSNGISVIGTTQDIYVTSGGTYTVTVSTGSGCSASASISITENPSPAAAVINTTGPLTLCDDDSNSPLVLNADTSGVGQGVTLAWNNFDDTQGSTQLSVYGSNLDFLIFSNPYSFVLIATNSFGCQSFSNPISVTSVTCQPQITLDLLMFIEGFTDPSTGMMDNGGSGGCLSIVGIPGATPTDADTVHVSLMNAVSHAAEATVSGILHTDGTLSVTFPSNIAAGNYFIRITHRNALETWSSIAIALTAGSNFYNFSDLPTRAFGSNMIQVFPGKWAIYSGDISDANYLGLGLGYQDGIIEAQDYLDEENAIGVILVGYQFEDITGDGIVESADYTLMENAVSAILFSNHP
jgi:hypothetical protein